MSIEMSPYERFDMRQMRTLGVRADDFAGRWHERHPWSAPGPFYGTTFNTLSLAALAADSSGLILFDGRGEFIWRQPMTLVERDELVVAMSKDEAMSYQIDGDARWTHGLVIEWVRNQLPQVLRWASDPATESYLLANGSGYLDAASVRRRLADVLRYYQTRGVQDLAKYGRALASQP